MNMFSKYALIYNGKVITEDECINDGCVLFSTETGKILDVLYEHEFDINKINLISNADFAEDAEDNYISPGFVDLHVHGGGGFDYMDGSTEAIENATLKHLEHGTTTIYPTTVACSKESLFKFFEQFKLLIDSNKFMSKVIAGIHLEGPYLNKKYKGAQKAEHCYTPITLHPDEIIDASFGNISRWSSAPELEKVIELGDFLRKNNILASIAHSDADYDVVKQAYLAGYSHLTHFYNAMSTIKKINAKRYLGVIESAYMIDDMTVEVVADGMHLPFELLHLVYKLKGADKMALITDAMRAAGMPDGEYMLGNIDSGIEVTVHDECAWMPGNTGFAGSTATTDRLVRNMFHNVGVDIVDSIKMASLTPAKIMSIDNKVGSIAIGKIANILIFDDNISIKNVFVNGKLV